MIIFRDKAELLIIRRRKNIIHMGNPEFMIGQFQE